MTPLGGCPAPPVNRATGQDGKGPGQASVGLPVWSQQLGCWPSAKPRGRPGPDPGTCLGKPKPANWAGVSTTPQKAAFIKAQPSDLVSLPNLLGYNHCQPICENHLPQGRKKGRLCWQADRLHTLFCLPGHHIEAMAGFLGLYQHTHTNSLTHTHLQVGTEHKTSRTQRSQRVPYPCGLCDSAICPLS